MQGRLFGEKREVRLTYSQERFAEMKAISDNGGVIAVGEMDRRGPQRKTLTKEKDLGASRSTLEKI
jgi:hypothetical protein